MTLYANRPNVKTIRTHLSWPVLPSELKEPFEEDLLGLVRGVGRAQRRRLGMGRPNVGRGPRLIWEDHTT